MIMTRACHWQIVLYVADWQNSEWNRVCASMSDIVLLVANANDEPQISFLEQVGSGSAALDFVRIGRLTSDRCDRLWMSISATRRSF
jgi:hypothetical protein